MFGKGLRSYHEIEWTVGNDETHISTNPTKLVTDEEYDAIVRLLEDFQEAGFHVELYEVAPRRQVL